MNARILLTCLLVSCLSFQAACQSKTAPVAAKASNISQFERAGFSEFLIDRNGVYHVVYQESPDHYKPIFIYYSTSTNNGQTWSKPLNISNDNTGNGSGYPRLAEAKDGTIYAVWKRYGDPNSQYPVRDVTLDGRGGYVQGTIFYKTLKNGTWSNAIKVSDSFQSQFSYFVTLHQNGQVAIVWNEVSPESLKNGWVVWYYADWVQAALLTPGGVTGKSTLNKPSPGGPQNGAPAQNGVLSMDGYFDQTGKLHMIMDKKENKQLTTWYFDGSKYTDVYKYPMYQEGNVFMNPAKLLYDEQGTDHIIIRPASSVLESEQVWDIIPSQKKQIVLAEITQKGVSISGIQAYQGPNGKMAVIIQAGRLVEATEAFGIFYESGKWTNVGITKNASKEKFFYKEFTTPLYRSYLSTLTRYSTTHTSVAYDKAGKPQITMTLSSDMMAGGYRVNNPSLVFVKLY